MIDAASWLDSAPAQVIASTLRLSTPLLLAAMGGLISERSGVINIALEGFMLVGAFAGAVAAHQFSDPWVGMISAMGVGGLFAALYAFFAIQWQANQIVAGTAINFLSAGLTPFFCKILFDVSGSTPTLPIELRLTTQPIVGSWMILAVLSWMWLRTPAGLWVRFAGEHPQALEASGVRVNRVRWFSVIFSGVLAGLAGATLSICLSSSFTRSMTAGRGFMALAAVIFGKWRPVPTALACLLFGFLDAIQMRLQGVQLGGVGVPVQFIQVLPYVATVIVLAGFLGRSRAPRSLGLPFQKV
jgi:ABC-type uncharacterized transport system permease subunit